MGLSKLHSLYNELSLHERVLIWILAAALATGGLQLADRLQQSVSVRIPDTGGQYTEGIVGFPRHINPVISSTNADRDITNLVYSGLMKKDSRGEVITDLAEEMSVNKNRTEYTFTINRQARFHDGHPVTAEDVVFTIDRIKDPQINSPRRGQWQDVSVEVVNERTVRFSTDEPFVALPQNATVGILPKHLWAQESSRSFAFSQLNTNPVGAGPYQVAEITKNSDQLPTTYQLTEFSDYVGGNPNIETINLKFFPDNQSRRQAFVSEKIDGMYGLDPAFAAKLAAEGRSVITRQYNRVFSAFFNQDQNETLADKNVREALAESVPKEQIVQEALAGYGKTVNAPLPPAVSTDTGTTSKTIAQPKKLLTDAGWATSSEGIRQKDGQVLEVTLTTVDIPSLTKAANLIKQAWSNLGVNTTVQTLPANRLTREVIRPRDYEVLLFGQSVSDRRDLYSFWHSSRQDDPGLNLARYTNSDADNLLESLRVATTSQKAEQLTREFLAELRADQPAAFLFSPAFTMTTQAKIGGLSLPPITYPADRFANVTNWYTDTKLLWKIFVNEKDKLEQ